MFYMVTGIVIGVIVAAVLIYPTPETEEVTETPAAEDTETTETPAAEEEAAETTETPEATPTEAAK